MIDIAMSQSLAVGPHSVRVTLELTVPDRQWTAEGFVRVAFTGGPWSRGVPNINGIPVACLQTAPPVFSSLEWVGNQTPGEWLFHAQMLDWTYRNREAAIANGLRWFGDGTTYAADPITRNFGSGSISFHRGGHLVVYIPGTTMTSQLLAQGSYFLQGPVQTGILSGGSMPLWADGVIQALHHALSLNASPDRVLFVGHSMGGAVSLLASAYLKRRGVPVIDALTFGTPKPGDGLCAQECRDAMRSLVQLANIGDPIPYLMLRKQDAPAWLFNVALWGVNWQEWRDCGAWHSIAEDGTISPGALGAGDVAELWALVKRIADGQTWLAPEAHYMPTYVERLRRAVGREDAGDF